MAKKVKSEKKVKGSQAGNKWGSFKGRAVYVKKLKADGVSKKDAFDKHMTKYPTSCQVHFDNIWDAKAKDRKAVKKASAKAKAPPVKGGVIKLPPPKKPEGEPKSEIAENAGIAL